MIEENPYTPPASIEAPLASPSGAKPAGMLVRLGAALVMLCMAITTIGAAANIRSSTDVIKIGLLSLMTFQFGAIVITGHVYPKSKN